jgi:hypothetical protein
MPRFFFHDRTDGALTEDVEGVELPDLDAARAEAVAAVRQLAAEDLQQARLPRNHEIDIADATGRQLVTVSERDVVED